MMKDADILAIRRPHPNLLWLYQMALILYWVHDSSPGQARSYRLAKRTVPIICRLIRLGSNPLLAPIVKSVMRLMQELRAEVPLGADYPAGHSAGLPEPKPAS